MSRFILRAGILLLLCAGWSLMPAAGIAQGEKLQFAIGTEPTFISGDYGTGSNIDITYLPVILEYRPTDRLRLTGEFPWIRQTSSEFTSAGGMFQHVQGGSFQAMNTESGPGDILLRGEYNLLPETGARPALFFSGDVKVPTADESRGLGTGEWDTGLAVEVGKTIQGVYLYGRLGYTFLGEPDGLNLDDPIRFEGGIGREILPQLYLNAFLAGSSAVDSSFEDPLSVGLNGDLRLRDDLSLTGLLEIGLSDGSPDYGLGIGFLQQF